jgi:hypothetical protein
VKQLFSRFRAALTRLCVRLGGEGRSEPPLSTDREDRRGRSSNVSLEINATDNRGDPAFACARATTHLPGCTSGGPRFLHARAAATHPAGTAAEEQPFFTRRRGIRCLDQGAVACTTSGGDERDERDERREDEPRRHQNHHRAGMKESSSSVVGALKSRRDRGAFSGDGRTGRQPRQSSSTLAMNDHVSGLESFRHETEGP